MANPILPRKQPMKNGKGVSSSFLVMMMVVVLLLITFGVIFSATMVPGRPSEHNVFSNTQPMEKSLREKILSWIPSHHVRHLERKSSKQFQPPDWSQEFWTPIDIEITADPLVTLCKLNFKQYSNSPHEYPMFRDLEGISSCFGLRKRKERLSVLMSELKAKEGTSEGRVIPPTGFVFHESRVGSTLVANSLASDPFAMVFSESAPAANALLHCPDCDRQRNVQIFRDVITLMGRSPIHQRAFFKFQSITSTRMDIALEAFPNVSWAFVYRQPVQTMMSHLDPEKGGGSGAPCLRSKRDPPAEVSKTIASLSGSRQPPKEAWCAAHLNMLCTHALDSYKKYGMKSGEGGIVIQRGLLINYESLPGIIPSALLPLFGVLPNEPWLVKMKEESTYYSKGRGKVRTFSGDSADKDERATQAIQKYAKDILMPTYDNLVAASIDGLHRITPNLFHRASEAEKVLNGIVTEKIDWSVWKEIPNSTRTIRQEVQGVPIEAEQVGIEEESGGQNGLDSVEGVNGEEAKSSRRPGHSKFHVMPFQPWAPFSNTHNSVPFEPAKCPEHPEADYPKTYPIMDLLNNWNADHTEIPPFHFDSLCHFDLQDPVELRKAENYRNAEKPFVAYNDPGINEVVRKWDDMDYLQKKLGKKAYRTETSLTNHFMYWTGGRGTKFLRSGEKWTPPTQVIQKPFEEWLERAVKGQNETLELRKHEYFRVSSDMGNNWLFDELPFFQPKKSFFMVEPREQRGIHCRFGMRNVISEAHFDGSRNFAVSFGGMRRWILTHPNQCSNMHMLTRDHPSGRHSAVDWSQPDVVKFPNFPKVQANEVILQPGDALYLPTYWIHFIVSLNVNFQCNTRSGRTAHFDMDIHHCGF